VQEVNLFIPENESICDKETKMLAVILKSDHSDLPMQTSAETP